MRTTRLCRGVSVPSKVAAEIEMPYGGMIGTKDVEESGFPSDFFGRVARRRAGQLVSSCIGTSDLQRARINFTSVGSGIVEVERSNKVSRTTSSPAVPGLLSR